jgi:hypothetical protein
MNKKEIPIIRKYSLLSGVLILIFLLVLLASKLTKQQSETTASDISSKKEVVETIASDAASNEISTNSNSTSTNVTLKSTEDSAKLDETVINEINDLVNNYYNPSEKLDENLLMESNKENGEVVKAISEKREGIEAYKNVKTYVRPGMDENS